jgi:hypothetical protein
MGGAAFIPAPKLISFLLEVKFYYYKMELFIE